MARRTQTYAVRLAVEGGRRVKAELVSVGQSGEQSLKRIASGGERASAELRGLGRQAELLRTGIRTLGGALVGVATVGGLGALVDRSISAADAIGKTADKIGVGVEALQELRFAAKASGVEQQTLDMALQRFTRRAAEAAQGTGEAKDALAKMGITLRDQSGQLRRSEELLANVADAFARIEDPAERVRLAFKLFDSEGVALVNLLSDGSGALEEMRERAQALGIVLDEHLVRDAERARTELDTLAQVISANLTRAALEAAPVVADLSGWLADVAGKAGIAWERLFDAPEERSLRTLRHELELTDTSIAELQARIDKLQELGPFGFGLAQIDAFQSEIEELQRIRGQTQARIAFLEGPPDERRVAVPAPIAADDTAGVQDRTKRVERITSQLESTLFAITHQGSERVVAEHERRLAEIEALRAEDGSNAARIDQLIVQSAAVRDAQLSQLRAKEVEAVEKVRAANERVVASLGTERAALAQTERQRFVAQAVSRLSAEATAAQRREVEELAAALFDEQQALRRQQQLMDDGRSIVDRTRTATERYATEIAKLSQLLDAGAIDQHTYARAVEDANERLLRSSQESTDGARRFLQDYAAESRDAASATEQAFGRAFSGAEDALVGFVTTSRFEFRSLADGILADTSRIAVRQSITGPAAGLLQGGFAGGGLFGLFHEGGIVGERPPGMRYAEPGVFEAAPQYHGGGFAGGGLLPDEVPIIARRGELVVPPERIVREERTERERAPITVVINVAAADANSFRASQGQIAAEMARAIDRAGAEPMTGFHEIRFPDNIAYGATGGPEFATTVVVTGAGHEQRNVDWAEARGRWDVASGLKNQAQLDELIAFFRARKGRAHGFRFRDWTDYHASDQLIGTGNDAETQFQLVKHYPSGSVVEVRAITRPVVGTVGIYLDGVEQLSGWSVDATSGIVTFGTAPAAGTAITADFEFDVPVRFDTDHMAVTIESFKLHRWQQIPIVELRV